jgi:hypothetical protein
MTTRNSFRASDYGANWQGQGKRRVNDDPSRRVVIFLANSVWTGDSSGKHHQVGRRSVVLAEGLFELFDFGRQATDGRGYNQKSLTGG